jgi:hypothetical protein
MPHSPCDLPVLCVRCERGMCGRVRVRRVCQRLWRRQWTGAVVFAFLISSLQEAVHKVIRGKGTHESLSSCITRCHLCVQAPRLPSSPCACSGALPVSEVENRQTPERVWGVWCRRRSATTSSGRNWSR